MSDIPDLKLAKKLIKKGYINEANAKTVLALQKAYLKKGKEVSLFKLLLKKEILSKNEIIEIKKSLGLGKTIKSPKATEEPKYKKNSEQLPIKAEEEPVKPLSDSKKPEPEKKEPKVKPAYAASKTCPECNSNVEIDAQECVVCAAVLPTIVTVRCSVCKKSSPSSSKSCLFCDCHLDTGEPGKKTTVCKSCKGVLLLGDALCNQCGKKVTTEDSALSKLGVLFLLVLLVATNGGFVFGLWTYRHEAVPVNQKAFFKKQSFYSKIQPEGLKGFRYEKTNNAQKEILNKVLALMKQGAWQELKPLLIDKVELFDFHLMSVFAFNLYIDKQKDRVLSLHKAYPEQAYLKNLGAEVLFQKSRELFEIANYPDAYEISKKVIELNPQSSEYHFWAGLIAYCEKDADFAEKMFLKNLELENPWVESNLFLYHLLKTKSPVDAKKYLEAFKKNG